MSEQLFPGAATVAPVQARDPRGGGPRPDQRLSTAALVLGALAFLGDLVILVLAIVTVSRAEPTSDAELLTSVLIVFGAIGAFWIGLLLAALGVVLGTLALRRRQRRGRAVAGLVLSIVTLCVNVGIGISLLFDPAQLSNLASLMS